MTELLCLRGQDCFHIIKGAKNVFFFAYLTISDRQRQIKYLFLVAVNVNMAREIVKKDRDPAGRRRVKVTEVADEIFF